MFFFNKVHSLKPSEKPEEDVESLKAGATGVYGAPTQHRELNLHPLESILPASPPNHPSSLSAKYSLHSETKRRKEIPFRGSRWLAVDGPSCKCVRFRC